MVSSVYFYSYINFVLTVISELVKMPEVLSVQVQRDFKTFAIVFRGEEEFHNDCLGDLAFDVDLDAERLVVKARVLDNNTDVVVEFLG